MNAYYHGLVHLFQYKRTSDIGPGWFNELGSLDYLATHISLSPIRRGFASGFVNYKKGALDSQPEVIKFTSCLTVVDGSLRVLRLLPRLKLVALI
jgi:hypothetical protein